MTSGADLTTRVRTNINEPSTADQPLRSDAEILQWLEDAQHDYCKRVPADAFPELIVESAVSAAYIAIPTDYVKLVEVLVAHTISGTYTRTETATVLNAEDRYFADFAVTGMGAWAQFRGSGLLYTGPNAYYVNLKYLKKPASLVTGSTFTLGAEHEEPIVNRATAMACAKINDEDRDYWMALYESRIQAEREAYGYPKEVERERE